MKFLNHPSKSAGRPAAGISAGTLKLIAIITMFIDHIGASCMIYYMKFHLVSGRFYDIYSLIRGIGRVSFPIFIFLLVEGFFHTKNIGKYLMRLFLFCLISEIPFNLAFYYHALDQNHQNVFFTLFIGLSAIAGIQSVNRSVDKSRRQDASAKMILMYLIDIIIAAISMLLAYFLKTDYSWAGVLAILTAYLLHSRPDLQMWGVCIILFLFSGSLEIYTLFCIPFISRYNGRRGTLPKWFAYLFYPVHLLLLWAVSTQLCGI